MKAYLVLDLSVNDLGGFRKHIAEIPEFTAKHSFLSDPEIKTCSRCATIRPRVNWCLPMHVTDDMGRTILHSC